MNLHRRNWILACTLGELIGIGSAGAIAVGYNLLFGEPSSIDAKLLNLAVMIFAGAIEGCALGYFQWKVLKKIFPAIPARQWVGTTTLIAAGGWLLGMGTALFFTGQQVNNNVPATAPPLFLSLAMALLMGLVLGAFFGFFQWLVFKKYARNTGYWIIGNALAWAVGMFFIFLFAMLPNENTPVPLIIISAIFGGILGGGSMGFVTGFYLNKIITRNP